MHYLRYLSGFSASRFSLYDDDGVLGVGIFEDIQELKHRQRSPRPQDFKVLSRKRLSGDWVEFRLEDHLLDGLGRRRIAMTMGLGPTT